MHKDRIKEWIHQYGHEHKQYVLYWMQQSQRVEYNHALNYAIESANFLGLPVVVCFNITDGYLGANRRHYQFMLEGLKEVEEKLNLLGIGFIFRIGDPIHNIFNLCKGTAKLIMDRGYLKHQLKWRKNLIHKIWQEKLSIDVVEIESDVLIPVLNAYPKEAYGAYAIRSSLMRKLSTYLDYDGLKTVNHHYDLNIKSDLNLEKMDQILNKLQNDQSVQSFHLYQGGYHQALEYLDYFLNHYLYQYDKRSDPSLGIQSYLSMYLHFGQISVQEIIHKAQQWLQINESHRELYDGFIEQLVVRRELAYNYVVYNEGYDQYETMTEGWALKSLELHREDQREWVYRKEEIEQSQTHDIYFNAAMDEMRITGFMANYMRMYWAKKIMEWSINMKKAYETIIELNNKYFIDGRDANSYANIAWCFGKHDKPWIERKIFGKVRYMAASGLEKKFDIDGYVNKINKLKAKEV